MDRKKFLKRCMQVLLVCSVLLSCVVPAFAQETLLIAGNADLYPLESYDHGRKCYVGLLPELYERLGESMGCDFVYLPYSEQTSQPQQAENRQADIISAYPAGTVSDSLLRERVLISVQEIDGETQQIYVGFTNALSQARAEALAQALEDISGPERLGILAAYTNESGDRAYRVRWLITLAALGAITLAAAAAFSILTRKRRAQQKANALIDTRYGIGNDRFYTHCMETLIPAPLKSLTYVVCFGCDNATLAQRLGEAEREELFHYTAEFLSRGCGREDHLACVDRGTFVLVCQCSSRETAQLRIEAVVRQLNDHLAGFHTAYGGLFRAGICSLDENPDCNAKAALYNARQGCAYAHSHELPYAFSTKRMIDESTQLERLRRRIMSAIANGEFEVYYQFVVNRDGVIVGAESVSRWQSPEDGLLPPPKYIELMIQTGAITAHDLYIFRQVCRQLQSWKQVGRSQLRLSCNFTRQSLSDASFLNRVRAIADEYDFPYDHLIIEITEDSLAYDQGAAWDTVEGLQAWGFRIALDDIGAGYSSLSDLSACSLDYVKVDRSILLNAAEGRGRKLLEELVKLSHSMGSYVLCEGVETQEQLDAALTAGCDFIQGFYFSRVLPEREAERYLCEQVESQ